MSVFIPTLTYGNEVCVRTEITRLQEQSVEMGFLITSWLLLVTKSYRDKRDNDFIVPTKHKNKLQDNVESIQYISTLAW